MMYQNIKEYPYAYAHLVPQKSSLACLAKKDRKIKEIKEKLQYYQKKQQDKASRSDINADQATVTSFFINFPHQLFFIQFP